MLAQACLSILLEYGNQCHEFRKTDFPLADYAAEHWVDHAKFGNVSVVIQDGMERLFDPERPQFAAWIWLYDMENPKKTLSGYYPRRPEITSLYYAVLCGFPRLVEHLINIRPQDIHARGGSYSTPLHAALAKGHPQVARLLILSGADTSSLDNHVRVPLHAASQNGHLDIARLLLDRGANIDAQDREGKTPLFLALDDGRVDVARLLLERGANAKSRSKHGWTPLHAVSGNGYPDIVLCYSNAARISTPRTSVARRRYPWRYSAENSRSRDCCWGAVPTQILWTDEGELRSISRQRMGIQVSCGCYWIVVRRLT